MYQIIAPNNIPRSSLKRVMPEVSQYPLCKQTRYTDAARCEVDTRILASRLYIHGLDTKHSEYFTATFPISLKLAH